MRLEDFLTANGIKYQAKIINGSKMVKIGERIRIHIYPTQITLCIDDKYMDFPPETKSFEKIKEIISNECN